MNCCTASTSHSSSSSSTSSSSSHSLKTSSRIGAMSRVLDYLYISSARSINYSNISKHKITHIINTTIEVPIIHLQGIKSIRIPVNDKIEEDLSPYFDDVSDFICEVSKNKGRVLIHCMAGISRSAAFVIAYLMKYIEMSLRDAYNLLHKKRPIVKPNGSFFRQLIEYEFKLFGKNSVKMVHLSHMNIEVPDLFVNEYKKMVLLEAIISRTRPTRKSDFGSKIDLIN